MSMADDIEDSLYDRCAAPEFRMHAGCSKCEQSCCIAREEDKDGGVAPADGEESV